MEHGLQILLKRFTFSVEHKMVVGAFGHAGWELMGETASMYMHIEKTYHLHPPSTRKKNGEKI